MGLSSSLTIISGAMSMILYGGLIGLAVAAFLRRPALPPSDNTSPSETDKDPSDETRANS